MIVPDGRRAEITILQQTAKVTLGANHLTFTKGNFPQPKTAVIDGLEIFKVRFIYLTAITDGFHIL